MIFWSYKTFSPSSLAEISALGRVSAVKTKIECVDSLIRDVALLPNEVAFLRKPNFSLVRLKLDFTQIELIALQALKTFWAAEKEKLKSFFLNSPKKN